MFSCFESTIPEDSRFFLELTPSDHVETSSNLTVLTYTDNDKKEIVPCDFRWTRIVDASVVELGESRSSGYICQPSDLGATIQAEVTSLDPRRPGKAVVFFGPVQMDLTLKPNIENIIVSDNCKQVVKIVDYGETKECYLQISSKSMQFTDMQGTVLLQLDYFVDSPVISLNARQTNKVAILFDSSCHESLKQFYASLFKRSTAFAGSTVQLTFVNRISRDMFIFSHKIFSAKKDLKVTELLMVIEQQNRLRNLLNVDSLLVVEYLRRDLKRYIRMYGEVRQQKQVCAKQVARLQEELENMRETYTSYIRECLKEIHPHTENSIIEELDEKNFQFDHIEENKHLKFRILQLNEQIELIRKTHKMKGNKRILQQSLTTSQLQVHRLISDMEDSIDTEDLKSKIKMVQQENIEIGKKFSYLLHDYENMKYDKEQLQKERLDCSFKSTQSQEAVSTINKLIGDIVELKKVNAELVVENERMKGRKTGVDLEAVSVVGLESRLKETQRLLSVSQESYQKMKEMFEKTQAKYDTPRSSSYSSVESLSTGRHETEDRQDKYVKKESRKVSTPRRKASKEGKTKGVLFAK